MTGSVLLADHRQREASETTTIDGLPPPGNVTRHAPPQRTPPHRHSTMRRNNAAISGALSVSCRDEVASRCAGPTDATCEHSHLLPRSRTGQTREGGTSQRLVDPLKTTLPAATTQRNHAREQFGPKHPNSETTSHSAVAEHRTGVAGKDPSASRTSIATIASARRPARAKSLPPGRAGKGSRRVLRHHQAARSADVPSGAIYAS